LIFESVLSLQQLTCRESNERSVLYIHPQAKFITIGLVVVVKITTHIILIYIVNCRSAGHMVLTFFIDFKQTWTSSSCVAACQIIGHNVYGRTEKLLGKT